MDARLARMKMANDRTSARRRHSRARDDPSRIRESRRARGRFRSTVRGTRKRTRKTSGRADGVGKGTVPGG